MRRNNPPPSPKEPLRPYLSWDREKLGRFKHALATLPEDVTHFTFEGNEFVVSYAHYLAAYLEIRLPRPRK